MFTFGYFADGVGSNSVAYYVVDKHGKVTHQAKFEAPERWMIHDCAVTEHYFLLPLMQYSNDVERMKEGGPFWVHEPEAEMIVGVAPRYGQSDEIRWLRGPVCVLSHTINAFEQDGKIKFDVIRNEGNCFGMVVPDREGRGGPFGSVAAAMVRWTIDPASQSDRIEECEVLSDVRGEGAHIDDRWSTRQQRYIWIPELMDAPVPQAPGGPGEKVGNSPTLFNGITYLDTDTGRKERWFAGDGSTLQDPVFAPRAADAPEGDGHILVVRTRVGVRGGDLVVLEAQNVAAGPVAVIRVPVPLRLGIHANWVPAHRLGLAAQFAD